MSEIKRKKISFNPVEVTDDRVSLSELIKELEESIELSEKKIVERKALIEFLRSRRRA